MWNRQNTRPNDETTTTFLLNDPSMALVIPPHNFIKMEHFTQDAIFLVLCDTIFSEDIYIYEMN